MYHRALEWIDERTAKFPRHVQQSLMIDEKARRPVRHHITAAPDRLQMRLAHRGRQPNFVPGTIVMPSGVFALMRAQNAGCASMRRV